MAQGDYRSKKSLRALLNNDPNFYSIKSQQFSRPQTTPFSPAKLSNFTSLRLPLSSRQKSSSTANIAKKINIQPSADKLKLKQSLGRVLLLAEGAITPSQSQQLQMVFALMNTLAKTQNHYQRAFQCMTRVLFVAVYSNQPQTYKDLCQNHLSTINNLQTHHKTALQDIQNQLINRDLVIAEKMQIISKLSREVNYYSKHPSQDLYPYINQLETQYQTLKNTTKTNLQSISKLQTDVEMLTFSNAVLVQQLQQAKNKLFQHQLDKLSHLKGTQQNSQMKEFQLNVNLLREMLQKSKCKVEGIRQQYRKVEEYNQQLIRQRSILAKRAAVGFNELTPRPNFKLLLSSYNELPIQEGLSTQDSVKRILQRRMKVVNNKKQSKKIKNNPMDGVLGQLDAVKDQISKTEQMAQEVKNAYARQQKEREKLAKLKE